MERQNEQGKEKRTIRLNILDVLIIIFLVLAVAAIGVRIYSVYRPFNNDSLTAYAVTFRMDSVVSAVPGAVQAGDTVYFSDNRVFGTVIADEDGSVFSLEPAKIVMQASDGTYVTGTYGDDAFVDAVGMAFCKGFVDENGYFLCEGVSALIPGQTVELHTEKADFSATVLSVEARE